MALTKISYEPTSQAKQTSFLHLRAGSGFISGGNDLSTDSQKTKASKTIRKLKGYKEMDEWLN